ncbi:tetratricopeptide repeat protein [Hallella mizrahii]|nr:tetratricopeptide repeat protein [Hallella mizrahii]
MKNLKSIFLLAIMFFACQAVLAQTDKGIEYYNNKDYANAVKCFQQAAEQGDAKSQNYMGECYYYGNGVTKNLQEAAKWYRKAAVQGNANAQNSLGYCYENGEGVEKNGEEAFFWYRKAAQQGDADGVISKFSCNIFKKNNI